MVVLAAAVNWVAAPESVMLCAVGRMPLPAVYPPNVTEDGFAPMLLTVRVTDTEITLGPPNTESVAVCVLGLSPAGSALMVTVEGVVPLAVAAPFTLSQLVLLLEMKNWRRDEMRVR